MTSYEALDKRACAACGASAAWNPTRQALVCRHCGTVAPTERDSISGEVREIDLVRTLRELPDERRGWLTEKRAVRCQSCEAVSVFDAGRVGQNCEFCGSPQLVDHEELKAPIRPHAVLPFRVEGSTARDTLRRWLAGRWFAPRALERKALLDSLRGVYLPYWTFDARVHCPWTANSGTYFYTAESYRDSKGRRRTRQVRHVRWRPASGVIDHAFDDEPVPGTRGVDRDLLRRIEPFPGEGLAPYHADFLAGFVVEHYRVVLVEALQQARESMRAKLRALCAAAVPGDTQQNLQIAPEFSGETFKHVLVPVWLLVYRYRDTAYQVVVNGHSGTIAGRYPKSWWKIAAAVLGAALIALAVALLAR